MALDLKNLTITKAITGLQSGEFTSTDLVKAYLANIEIRNKDLNAYLEVFSDVLDQAKKADELRASGAEVGPLTGVPIAIKDNILIKGRVATAASKMLADYRATYDATVIEKLKQAGAIFIGRTNMDEFAMGGSTENSAFGPTRNPYDSERVAGGSSGGSAAVVGGDLALCALGSDTGGSIRQPASFCGVVGLKPTYGTVSRHGVMAMASSLDQIGPITKTVEDAETLYKIIAGRDSFDSTSVDPKLATVSSKLVIGVPTDFVSRGLDAEVKQNFDETLKKLTELGHEVRQIELPNLKYSLACYYVLMPAEVSSNMSRFDGVRYGSHVDGLNLLEDYMKTRGEGFGPEVRRRIMLGTYVLSAGYYDAYYGKACGVRQVITNEYKKAFDKNNNGVDLILTPTAPTPAFPVGAKVNDPLQMYLEDIFTVPVNLAGVPAISVPSGVTKSGLPLGVQFTADHFNEEVLFAIGKQFFGA
ncbi:MAG: Asp-tRNA(Asn)/Glu-tRNA(Gln) amidotransferase subunit GatA [Candidatus Vogelbacteria bacterium]|nr:Asp-tRNA(Asn)/Glu-tRNA(Gln) amidotransferase subunit GatA [Candidatus Vogelbacteria bacterium]